MTQNYEWLDGWDEEKQAIITVLEGEIVKAEIRAKLQALDKLIMGAGEYHDDPYEYVVPLRHIQNYRAGLRKFDLSQPIFREALNQYQSNLQKGKS